MVRLCFRDRPIGDIQISLSALDFLVVGVDDLVITVIVNFRPADITDARAVILDGVLALMGVIES